MKLTIDYYYKRCIGAKKCIEVAPDYFSFDGKKAALKHSISKDGVENITFNSSLLEIETLKKAAEMCPVNAIKLTDVNNKKVLVSTELNKENVEVIESKYDDSKEFVLDHEGYFLIRIDNTSKNIEVGFCNSKNIVILKVIGKKPIEIYHTIINKISLNIRKDHCAYLGRELKKAYIALKKGIKYVQDDELEL